MDQVTEPNVNLFKVVAWERIGKFIGLNIIVGIVVSIIMFFIVSFMLPVSVPLTILAIAYISFASLDLVLSGYEAWRGAKTPQ